MVGVVIGNYQIVRKLGGGGMGVVYVGQHKLLGRRAAIKILLPTLSARPDIVNRFFNEARAVTSISDPGIVQVFDFGYHTDGSAFIVMELLEGESLDQRLARRGRFSAYEALRLCRQVATSLAAAHAQHIIHRDLKPENIFLVRDAEVASGERSKILDFGIAKLSDEHPGKIKTHTGALMGTPVYMSPEQCRGLPEIDHRSDIYALGCVMFHLIVGRPPFDGEGMGDIISAHIREPAPAPSSMLGGIPHSVDALLLRCLAKSPAERFQTMTELAQAIAPVLAQLPMDAGSYAAYGGASAPSSQPPGTPPPPQPSSQPPGTPPPPPGYSPPGTSRPVYSQPPGTSPPSYAAPTTLGASAGQVGPARSSPSVGRWIAAGLVVAAVGVGISILGTRGGSATPVAAKGNEAASSPVASPVAPRAVTPAAPTAPAAPALTPPAVRPDAAVEAMPNGDAAVPEVTTPDPVPDPAPKRTRDRTHKTGGTVVSRTPGPTTASSITPAHPPSAAPAAPVAAPINCSKAAFAAVYDAAVPPPGAVRAALRNLKACRDAGAISDAELERYQTALVAKL